MRICKSLLTALLGIGLLSSAHAAEIQSTDWNETPASNTATPPNGWPENMLAGAVNDTAREDRASVKRWFDRWHGLTNAGAIISTAGTTSAFTVTFSTAPATLFTGFQFCTKFNAANAADATINVNSLGAKIMQKITSAGYVNLAAGDVLTSQSACFRFDSTLDRMIMLTPAAGGISASSNVTWTGTHSFTALVTTTAAIDLDNWQTVASATTTDIGAATSNLVAISGTATITGLGTANAGVMRVFRATGAFTITWSSNIVGPKGDTSGTHGATVGEMFVAFSQGGGVWNVGTLTERIASQSSMEAGTTNSFAISPGRAQFHPSAGKAWCMFDGTATSPISCTAGYNVTDVTRVATGRFAINIATDFSTANYVCTGMSGVAGTLYDSAGTQTAGAFPLRTQNSAGTATNDTNTYVVCYGDQ